MYIVNMASVCTHEETSFVSLDDVNNISILLDEDHDFEEEITYLFVFLFSSLKKNTTNQALKILKTCTIIQYNFCIG